MLRDDERVGRSEAGRALLAGDQDPVDPRQAAVRFQLDDVEAEDIHLPDRRPADQPGAAPRRALEVDEDTLDHLQDAGAGKGWGRAIVADVPDAVAVAV